MYINRIAIALVILLSIIILLIRFLYQEKKNQKKM
jgi:hypothetical protein